MLFRWAYNDKYSKTIDEMYDQLYSLGLFEVKRKRKERRMIFDFLSKIENEDSARHVVLGVPAKEAKRYTQRKEAIEYVYRDSIPMEDVEKIGEVNVADLRRTAEYDPLRPMRSIFSALLKGNPEQKGALLLNC